MSRMLRAAAALSLAALAAQAHAHGGVSMEDDVCVMRVGQYLAHFSGYQPEFRATQEFCEDIPELGKAIIVLDFIDPALRKQVVEFRVLADARALGMSARYEQLGSAADIDAATLARIAPQPYPRGTLTFEQAFLEPGWYIGLFTATDPQNGTTLNSVFPFRVGVKNPWRYVPAFVVVIALSLLAYRLTGRGLRGAAADRDDA
ncbi:MAG: hypothetical protein WC809_02015 [Sinimarinibacterium sp.]